DLRILAVLTGGRSVIAFAGSSTTGIGEYPTALMAHFNSRWRTGHNIKLSELAEFTFEEGLHSVNAGASGMGASGYLGSGRGAAISGTNPSIVFHGVGSSDWAGDKPASQFRDELEAAVSSLTSNVPLLHVLVHQHERINASGTPSSWDDYGEAMREVADAADNRIFVDASQEMRDAGVGVGLDNRY